MSAPHPVFDPEALERLNEFGREFLAAFREGLEELAAAMKRVRLPTTVKLPTTEEVRLMSRETASIQRYKNHVAGERALGLLLIKKHAAQVRQELGL